MTSISKPIARNLCLVHDDISLHKRSLKLLKSDVIIIFILTNKLDKESLTQREETKKSGDFPTLTEFKTFLNHKAGILETKELQKGKKSDVPKQRNVSFLASTTRCNFCK